MKQELNTKEWLAIYGLLERHAGSDKHLTEIYNRMKANLVVALNTTENLQSKKDSQFQAWFSINDSKVRELTEQRNAIKSELIKNVEQARRNVLTDDDDENEIKVTVKDSKKSPPSRPVGHRRTAPRK